jgi:hypothetical protein
MEKTDEDLTDLQAKFSSLEENSKNFLGYYAEEISGEKIAPEILMEVFKTFYSLMQVRKKKIFSGN